MDTTELRRAFNLSESIYERVRQFRELRISRFLNKDTPIPLKDGAKIVLHLIPLESFRSRFTLDFSNLQWYSASFKPLAHQLGGGWSPRHNFVGAFIFWQAMPETMQVSNYVQIYRNGIVEAAVDSIENDSGGKRYLSAWIYEQHIVEGVERFVNGMKGVGITPPIWAFISLIDVKGAKIHQGRYSNVNYFSIDRDILQLPKAVINDLDVNAASLLRPSFDLVWNAAGLPRSANFDEEGNFKPNI